MLNIDNCLVLMIDFQDKLIKATSADIEAQNAEKMLKAAKILNIQTIVSEQYPKGLGSTSQKLLDAVPEDAKFIEKTAFSLLKEENALDLIKSFEKNHIILFGIETHICVLQTALDLLENGFEVYLIRNACKSRSDYESAAGTELMKEQGVQLLTLETALFQLLRTSKHPKFKEVQALIK